MMERIHVFDELVERIRKVIKGFEGVVSAAVFGSILWEGRTPHDIDLAGLSR